MRHLSLAVLLGSGIATMNAGGWGPSRSGWLGMKLGLVILLVVPLEAFHAYLCHVWIPRARRSDSTGAERQLERGLGMEAIVQTISIPLYLVAIPLLFWLSLRQPF